MKSENPQVNKIMDAIEHLLLETSREAAGNLSHSIRNDIFYLLHIFKDISKQDISDNAHKSVEKGIEGAKQILFTIECVLAELKNRTIDENQFEKISVKCTLKELIQKFNEVNDLDNIISCTGDDFELSTDIILFNQLFDNLISNALYFIQNKENATIEIKLHKDSQQISVIDTGTGIPPDIIDKIFDRRFTHNKEGGTGLGLAYCKRTMEALGGSIHCESKLGEYTEFLLTF